MSARRILRFFLPCVLALLAAPSARAGRGGPDAGNWSWADSYEPGVDKRLDPILTPTDFTLGWGDEEVFRVDLSFPVTLYGTTSTAVWVSSNGWISLADPLGTTAPVNAPIPTPGVPDAAIAVWWDDLYGGFSSFGTHGPTASGHRIDVRLVDKTSDELLQYYLHFGRNGSIKILYAVVPSTRSATVGIEDGAGSAGTQLLYNGTPAPGAQVSNDYALVYYPTSAPDCAGASGLACGTPVSGSTASGASQVATYGCSAQRFTGRETVHRFTPTGAQRFTATLAGTAGQALFLLGSGCDGMIGCIDGGTTSITRSILGAGDYYLVVDGATPAADGPYTITTSCTPVSTPLACGATVNGTPTGPSAIDTYSCVFNTFDGPELIYDFSLATPQTVSATLGAAAPWDVVLADAATLAPVSSACLRHDDNSAGVLNLPAGNYVVIVDGPSTASGSFSLTLDCQATVPAAAASCGSSTPSSNAGPNFADSYPCGAAAGYVAGEAWFRFQPAQRTIASFTPSNPVDYDVFAFRTPQAISTCLGAADATLTLVNVTPGDYLVDLDAGWLEGPVSLQTTCQPFAPPALACGATVSGTTPVAPGLLADYGCLSRQLSGSESFFTLTNPVTQTLAVGVSGLPPGQDVDVAVFGPDPFDAATAPCLAGGNNVAVLNGAPPGEYLVAVDGWNGAMGVPFQLTAACGNSSLSCAAAPALACNSLVAGDTATGSSGTFAYGTADGLFTGPEIVYRFTNPVKQNVNFLLRNASDPRLDLFLLRACDPTQAVDWDDDALIEPGLDPGDYYLVVDGREGAAGSFELVAFCGGAALDPPVLTRSLQAGACVSERKKLYFPTSVPAADVVFSFDLSGSMSSELDQMKLNARSIYTTLNTLIPSLQFGLASFVEYDACYSDPLCGVPGSCPPAAGAFPFRMDLPLTPDINLVDTVLQIINIIGGAKETYTTTFWEAATNPVVGWRTCSRRLWLSFGDEPPVDCNWLACVGGNANTGMDPGPDLVTGTPDDRPLLTALDLMAAANIALIPVESSEDPNQVAAWDCLARRTGGQVFATDAAGRIPDGTDIVRGLTTVIKETLRPCPEVRLVPTGPQASWVTIAPASYTNILTPFYGEFDVTFCVPAGTPPGAYSVPVEARCIGAGSCSSELLGTQSVSLTVLDPCSPAPTAVPSAAPGSVCLGTTVTLDGSASQACNASGLEYRWLDGAVEVCPWSASPTCDVTPARSTTYLLEVRCLGVPAPCTASATVPVEVVPFPAAALAPLAPVCAGSPITLDASASLPQGCPVALEYQFRDGATILRPWGPAATFGPLVPPATTTYTVEVRCTASPGCVASSVATVDVVPIPRAAAGPDASVCADDPLLLDGSGSSAPGCPGGVLYEWRNGATVVRPASPVPTWQPPTSTPGTTTYTLVVSCAGPPSCSASDDVRVEVRSCPLAVDFGEVRADRGPDGVTVTWTTLAETDTLGFVVERAAAPAGPFVPAAEPREAHGPLRPYSVLDAAAPVGLAPWYRIVEVTIDGSRGDATPPFTLSAGAADGAAGRARRRATRHR